MPERSTRLRTLETCWRREMEAATTYRILAERERDPRRREILTTLAEAELRHAARWADRIREAGAACPTPLAFAIH